MDQYHKVYQGKENGDFVLKCQAILKAKGIDASLLSQTCSNHCQDLLKEYQQNLMKFGEETATKYLQNILPMKFKAVASDKELMNITKDKTESKENSQSSKRTLQEILVEKDKQIEYQSQLLSQWKEQQRSSLGQWKAIEKKFKKRLRKCIPLQFIITQKITSLKIIHIVYQQECFRYSISAFRLFKMIHLNKQLKEATVKGVQIELFQYFLRKMRTVKIKAKDKENKLSNWMIDFKPSKLLRLSINAELEFYISNRLKSGYRINELFYFTRLFCVVSDIMVKVYLGKCKDIDEWTYIMNKLVKELNKMENVKVEVLKRRDYINRFYNLELVSVLRSGIFGGLASLASVARLQLNDLDFCFQSDFPKTSMAFEQTMQTLFKNNAINHLKLNKCRNFPLLPKITTLQSICLSSTFRRPDNFLRSLVLENPQLKSIELSTSLELTIDNKLFDQLQRLIIYRCFNIQVGHIRPQTTSNIKQLKFVRWQHFIVYFPVLLPKLSLLARLEISNINFDDFVLQYLNIESNNLITQKGVEEIDKKWPQLRRIRLAYCQRLYGISWTNCKFQGLLELSVDYYKTYARGKQALQALKSKGIKIFPFS